MPKPKKKKIQHNIVSKKFAKEFTKKLKEDLKKKKR